MDGKTNLFEQRVSEYSLSEMPSDAIFELEDLEAETF